VQTITKLKITFIAIAVFTSGCSTLANRELKATPYAVTHIKSAEDIKSGLNIIPKSNYPNAYLVVFSGNTYTSSLMALEYTIIASFEECARQKKYGLIATPENLSQSTTYTQVYSSTSYTPTGRGTYIPNTRVSSYPVTETAPAFVTTAYCKTKMYEPKGGKLTHEDISRDVVTPYTKDFKGGVLIKSVEGKSVFQEQDVIVSVNGKRVETFGQFESTLDSLPSARTVTVKIIRNNQMTTVKLDLVDITKTLIAFEAEMYKRSCDQVRTNYDTLAQEALGEHEKQSWEGMNSQVLNACKSIESFVDNVSK
jgi:membrane-associated protease RseP (regulator of RpoE activity)